MPNARMQYVIFVEDDNDESVMFAAPVPDVDSKYLRDHVMPTLRALTDEEYMQGPAIILHTLARYSYVLHKDDLYWCSEWPPGLIVVRLSPDGTLAWSVLRSPNPEFGGRQATEEELELFDEDAENHQYNLVFNAWDAQFDEDVRKWRSFVPADPKTRKKYLAALDHVNSLGEIMQSRYSQSFNEWSENCKKNIEKWSAG